MKAYTYISEGRFEMLDKPRPSIRDSRDAIVRVTLGSICTSDLHIKHGSVPRAVPGITVGHEMVGVVEEVGSGISTLKPGDRVAVDVETYCGECWFCKHGYVNNCQSPDGGWALGCRIDGGQAEYVRVPFADQGLTKIPDSVSDEQALFTGDILATGFWAARISEIKEEDTVLIIGAGPTGICTLLCVMIKHPKRIIVCEKSEQRRDFIRRHYPEVIVTTPEECMVCATKNADHGGADVVIEVAGSDDSFTLAWQCARPNAIVTVVALYDKPQILPLPQMYGKNLTFKTGGVDGCDCKEILSLIEKGLIDTTPLITHRYPLSNIDEAYDLFENHRDGVIKVAIYPEKTVIMDKNRITPEYISELKDGEVFVFGSNKEGMHGGGAARTAYMKFGAQWGVGIGMTGSCYAIPTMDGSLDIIRAHVDDFTAYAKAHPELTFLVTPIGCGIAGWRESEIAPLFKAASVLPNVWLPESFWQIINADTNTPNQNDWIKELKRYL